MTSQVQEILTTAATAKSQPKAQATIEEGKILASVVAARGDRNFFSKEKAGIFDQHIQKLAEHYSRNCFIAGYDKLVEAKTRARDPEAFKSVAKSAILTELGKNGFLTVGPITQSYLTQNPVAAIGSMLKDGIQILGDTIAPNGDGLEVRKAAESSINLLFPQDASRGDMLVAAAGVGPVVGQVAKVSRVAKLKNKVDFSGEQFKTWTFFGGGGESLFNLLGRDKVQGLCSVLEASVYDFYIATKEISKLRTRVEVAQLMEKPLAELKNGLEVAQRVLTGRENTRLVRRHHLGGDYGKAPAREILKEAAKIYNSTAKILGFPTLDTYRK